MIANLEDLKARILRQNITKWVVFPLGKSESAVRQSGNCASFKDPDMSLEIKLSNLEEWYEEEQRGGGGKYELVETDKTSDACKFAFAIYPERMQYQPQQQQMYMQNPNIGQIPDGYLKMSEVETKLENERLKLRLESLENEVKDLRKENQSLATPTADFFKQVTPFIQPILSGLLKRPSAQIGTLDAPQQTIQEQGESEEELDLTDSEFKLLCDALRRWKEADQDYLDIIVALSNFTNDPMYDTAKQFVLKK